MTDRSAEAAAKLNLALAVTGRRGDGYHLLRSVFVRLALHDTLEVQADPAVPSDTLEVQGSLAAGDDNLVLRACRELRAAIDPGLPPLRFRLHKRIPVSAGLGGGSADAAAAIDLSLAAWGVALTAAERGALALRLGADVPFLASGEPAALVEGIGERVRGLPVPDPPAGILLLTPARRLSTADVFAEHDQAPSSTSAAGDEAVDRLAAALVAGIDGAGLAALTASLPEANDLWPAARRLAPELATAREVAESLLARPLLLTGSGPTLVAVYPSPLDAVSGAARLEAAAVPELAGATVIATTTSSSARGAQA